MGRIHSILILLGAAFVIALVWTIGPSDLWRKLTLLGWGIVPLILCEAVAEMVHTLGWRKCLCKPLSDIPFIRLFQIRMAGYAINYLTPSAAMGGELTRATLLASRYDASQSITAVLSGKVCFALAHLLFVTIGVPIIVWRIKLPGAAWIAMISSGCLVGGGILCFLLLQRQGKLGSVFRWLASRKPGSQFLLKLAERITEVDAALATFYRRHLGDMFAAILWHLVGFSIGIIQTWLFFRLLNRDASLSVAASTWFLGMWFDLLTFAVPMNLGTLEGTRVLTLKAGQFGAVLGLTYGVALRLAQLTCALVGLLCYAHVASQFSLQKRAGQKQLGVPRS
jgi:uncharacterized protein (TIRG00374 family)